MEGALPEAIRRGYAAWNDDDFEAFRPLLNPDVEWHSSGTFPGFEPVYRGPEGVLRFWHTLKDPFERFGIELESVVEHGEAFIVTVVFTARGKGSGAEARLPFVHMFVLDDQGLIVRFGSYRTVEEARAAAG